MRPKIAALLALIVASSAIAQSAPAIADLTGAPILTVRSWAQRNSIPSKHWGLLVSEKHCTADELMSAAAKRAA